MAEKVGAQRNRPGEVSHYLADRVTDRVIRIECGPVRWPIRLGLNAIDLGKWAIGRTLIYWTVANMVNLLLY